MLFFLFFFVMFIYFEGSFVHLFSSICYSFNVFFFSFCFLSGVKFFKLNSKSHLIFDCVHSVLFIGLVFIQLLLAHRLKPNGHFVSMQKLILVIFLLILIWTADSILFEFSGFLKESFQLQKQESEYIDIVLIFCFFDNFVELEDYWGQACVESGLSAELGRWHVIDDFSYLYLNVFGAVDGGAMLLLGYFGD